MSRIESTSKDLEHMDTEELRGQNLIEDVIAGQIGTTSEDRASIRSQRLIPFQDLSGRFGELVVPTTGGTTVTSPVDNTVAGGEFYNPNFGPVTHNNAINQEANITRIERQNVVHYHHYPPGKADDSSTALNEVKSGEKKNAMVLTGSIKLFTDQKLHKTKLIYKGEKTTAGKPIPVVVKLMNYSKEALREAECLHCIDSHPNVVRICDSGTINTDIKYIFIAMELCSHETLLNYINQNVCFNSQQALQHSTQIISGLEYIHSKKILHRDLKPDNILFSLNDGYDQVKITDFGMSKNYVTDPNATSQAFGTQGYVAPEIIKDEKCDDLTKCDIFSLGILLVFVLTNGKHPYGEKPWQWTFNIANGEKPNLSGILLFDERQRNAAVSIISKMLQKDPQHRPTAEELHDEWKKGFFYGTRMAEPGNHLTRECSTLTVSADKSEVKEIDIMLHNSGAKGIVGFSNTRSKNDMKLLFWKSVEEMEHVPKIIFEMPLEVFKQDFIAVANGRCIYLLMKSKNCYELDLDNVMEGWKKLEPMKHDHGRCPPATVLNGKLYVCGSRLGDPSKKCEVFSMGQWSDISEMNEARDRNCTVSYKGYLYSVGGKDTEMRPLRSVERYDPSTDTWEFAQSLNTPRIAPHLVVKDDKMYALGGFEKGETNWISSFECYDPSTSEWLTEWSISAWWRANKPRFPFVMDNKVFGMLFTYDKIPYTTISEIPFGKKDERKLKKVELQERFQLFRIVAFE